MKLRIATIVLGISGSVMAQQPHSIHISVSPRSNVSALRLRKELEHRCVPVDIATDSEKAAYNLEALHTESGRKRYNFIVFKDGDRVFSTETHRIKDAVKDVCFYLEK